MPDEEIKESPPAEPRKKVGPGVMLLVFLLIFGCLGAFAFLEFIMFIRAMFGGAGLYLLARLAWFALPAVLIFFAFRRYRSVRSGLGGDLPVRIGLALLPWCVMFAGAVVGRSFYQTPGERMGAGIENDQQACREHAKAVLSVYGITDSHEPGAGYITVKAMFAARKPVSVFGGDWVETSQAGIQFYSEMERTALQAGQPREITFHVLVNPEHDNSPALAADGPYQIQEIKANVYDPAVTDHWATWAGDISCTAPVIRNYTTHPYKAAEFGRLKWDGKNDSSFKPAPPAAGEDQLTKEAKAQLKEADELLEDADNTAKKYKVR